MPITDEQTKLLRDFTNDILGVGKTTFEIAPGHTVPLVDIWCERYDDFLTLRAATPQLHDILVNYLDAKDVKYVDFDQANLGTTFVIGKSADSKNVALDHFKANYNVKECDYRD